MSSDSTSTQDNVSLNGKGVRARCLRPLRDIHLIDVALVKTMIIDFIEFKTQGMKEGDKLVLRRNVYDSEDPMCIRVEMVNREIVGVIPRYINTIIARLMDAGMRLSATVVKREVVEGYVRIVARVKLEGV